jgi:4-hydroxybenzoate polyprenyltransferase
MAVSGALIFGYSLQSIIAVFIAVFMASAAGYANNHMTDSKEDVVNNRRLNHFVADRVGRLVIAAVSIIGFLAAITLPPPSFIFFIFCYAASMGYSLFGAKRMLLVKNLYTGIIIGGSFLVGATSGGSLAYDMVAYYLIVFAFGVMLNMLGDIRGIEGDRLNGIRTIPVVLGAKAARKAVYSIIIASTISLLYLGMWRFYPLIPFMLAIYLFVFMRNDRGARASIISSFAALPVVLLFIDIVGGY